MPSSSPVSYEIRIRGPLGPTLLEAFPEVTATRQGHDTLLSMTSPDQAALYGVLHQVEALGLELVEVRHRDRPSRVSGNDARG